MPDWQQVGGTNFKNFKVPDWQQVSSPTMGICWAKVLPNGQLTCVERFEAKMGPAVTVRVPGLP